MIQHLHTELIGTLTGPIWMPHTNACLDIRVNLTREQPRIGKSTLRELLLFVLSERDGDFRHAQLANGRLVITFHDQARGRRVVRHLDLANIAVRHDLTDLLTEEEIVSV